eukprot:EC819676.1.p1 GENE.EC819676.1~~EC819676.1.p1  ORF type:complete len:102 (+),score=56.41 EC819676.1:16-321(+)
MGRMNGCKAADKRERNLKKKQAEAKKNKPKEKPKDVVQFQCKACLQTFMAITSKQMMQTHCDSKHQGKTFEDCFPDYDKVVEKAKEKEMNKNNKKKEKEEK